MGTGKRDLNEQLLKAVDEGNLTEVRLYLDWGADPNYKGDHVYPPLCLASKEGHTEITALLLEKDADVRADNDEALRYAAKNGHTEIVALLLEKGAYVRALDDEALRWAAKNGHTETVALLLKEGADVRALDDYAMRWAAYNGHTEAVALLLKKGADVRALDDEALRWASGKGHTETVALLLEKGADIHAKDDYALRWSAKSGHTETVALLLENGAHYDRAAFMEQNVDDDILNADVETLLECIYEIEELIAKEKKKGNTPSPIIRRLAYSAAAIGAELYYDNDVDDDNPSNFIKKTMEASLGYTALKRSRHGIQEAGSYDHISALTTTPRPEELHTKLGLKGYTNATAIKDMVSEYAEAVLLPHLLEAANFTKGSIVHTQDIESSLMSIAADIMLSGKNLLEMVEMSKAWHRAGNSIPDELRPLRGGIWHALIPDTETPITTTIDDEEETLTIRALSSQDMLKRESGILNHCVGRSNYGSKCLNGITHILSIQAGGKPIATLEASINDNGDITRGQFHGKNDGKPPPAAKQAWEWFERELKKPESTVKPNPKPKTGWGEKESEAAAKHPQIIKTIGYDPTAENVQACHDHLCRHLLLKAPIMKSKRHEGGFHTHRRLQESYERQHAMEQKSVDKALAACGRWDDFNELVEEVAAQMGTTPKLREKPKITPSMSP